MIESNTQEPHDQVGFFSQLTNSYIGLDKNFSTSIKEQLPNEVERNAKEIAAEGAKFCREIIDEAKELTDGAMKLKEKIKNHIAQGPGKSFLKSDVSKYESFLPTFKICDFERLVNFDIDACNNSVIDIKQRTLDQVVESYNAFMEQQQAQLKAFVLKQEKLMYGYQWRPVLAGTKLFNKDEKNLPTYSWPETDQMMDWSLDSQIKLTKVWYKSWRGEELNGLKLEFNDGSIVSTPCDKPDPVQMHGHMGRRHMGTHWRCANIDKSQTITRFSMFFQEGKDVVSKMSAMAGEDEILNIQVQNNCHGPGEWVHVDIPKGKEIIGLYANNSGDKLKSIGFNLWTPNPMADTIS